MSSQIPTHKESEKGAAMVMVLLISLLLLTVSAGLLMESSMNTQNVTDATAEYQAYNAAESGLQAAINALRGNVVPNPLINPSESANHISNKINFRRATNPAYSNTPGDTSSGARLSRWLDYNYTPGWSTNTDRVTLGSGTYDPNTGYAYSVTVTDPDNTGDMISYTTTGKFLDLSGLWQDEMIIGSGLNLAKLVYEPANVSNLDVSGGSANASFGRFRIIPLGIGAVILGADLRFQLIVNMTAPYTGTRVMRGWLKVSLNSPSLLQFDFDSKSYDLMGSKITLTNDPINVVLLSYTNITGTITQPEPYRVLVRSTGYGPNGARKQLEAMVQKNFFNGMTAPATITMVGLSVNFKFDAGNSENVTYSGIDVVSDVIIPPVGVTNTANLTKVKNELCSTCKPNTNGTPSDVLAELPFWLENTTNLNSTINDLRNVAKSSGRYFTGSTAPTNFGNNTNGTGITFVDGDVSFSGAGGGILICTGKLTLHGGFDFKGLIIVTGTDGILRNGGGAGTLQGNIVIAPYNPNNISAGFLSPKYDISGGGDSKVIYNSSSWDNGMAAVSNFVVGVAEK